MEVEMMLARALTVTVALMLAIALSVAACGGDDGASEATDTSQEAVESPAEAAPPSEEPEDQPANGETSEQPYEEFDRDNFDDPTTIDNEWLPLVPGTQHVYEGVTIEDGEEIPHRVVITITDLTKVIDGVHTVVSWDRDFSEDELVEAELAFYAQDNDGNVWRMGEYPEEYEDGEFADAPAWIAGLQDARAGIRIKAVNEPGDPSYSQGWAPAVEFTDRAQTYDVGQETCVQAGCYEDVLIMDEFSEEEPGAFQQKYYAPGVGNVQVGWRGEDPNMETLELIEVVTLSEDELSEARSAAFELEESAYEHSPDLYGETPPLEPAPS